MIASFQIDGGATQNMLTSGISTPAIFELPPGMFFQTVGEDFYSRFTLCQMRRFLAEVSG